MSDWGNEIYSRRNILKAVAVTAASAALAPKALQEGANFINLLTTPAPPEDNINIQAANRVDFERRIKKGNFMTPEDSVKMYLAFTGDKTPDKSAFKQAYPGVEIIDQVESGDDGLHLRDLPGVPSDSSPGRYNTLDPHTKLPFPGLVVGKNGDGLWAITKEDDGKLAYFSVKNTKPVKSNPTS